MSIRFHCVAFFHVLTHPAEGITPSYFWSLDDWALSTPGYHHPWAWWCHFVMSHDATACAVVCNSMPCSRIMCFLVIKGRVRHLFLSSGELKQYLIQTERVLQRYAHRMQWLLSGEHHHTELQHEIIYSALCKYLFPPSPLWIFPYFVLLQPGAEMAEIGIKVGQCDKNIISRSWKAFLWYEIRIMIYQFALKLPAVLR